MIILPIILAAATPAATPAKPNLDKIICKREEVTGSLAGFKKICHTAEEWKALSDKGHDEAERLIDAGYTSCGECKRGG